LFDEDIDFIKADDILYIALDGKDYALIKYPHPRAFVVILLLLMFSVQENSLITAPSLTNIALPRKLAKAASVTSI